MTSMTRPFEEARKELFTVRDMLRFAISQFNEEKLSFGHGCSNAFDEAAYLILHNLKLPLDQLDPFLDAHLTTTERNTLLHMLYRRARAHVPAAYLTQEAWLGEFRFYVDERVIVPRSFISELIPEQLTPWIKDPDKIRNILDMCTGSGCLAIMLASCFPDATVDAVDISADALAVANRNVTEYGLGDRLTLIQSDLFKNLPDNKRYDLIISNPPYVDAASMKALPEEYRAEPELALASGKDGLDAVRNIMRQARSHLNRGGLLIMEIGHNRAVLETAFPDTRFTWLTTSAGDDFVCMLNQDQLS